MEHYCIDSPLGPLSIRGDADGISTVEFHDDRVLSEGLVPPVLNEAVTQIREYFEKSRSEFDLKLNPSGTEFQRQVWDKLMDIPHGKTLSYQKLANELGDPKVIRAAASANGKNPIAIIIPCHRVIGSDGSLTGYAGGLHRKKWLLEHESRVTQTVLF